jgi:hypothetical protein
VEDQNAENARRPGDVPEGLDAVDPEAKRAAARLKAKESLIASLAGGDFSNQQTRVAHILNLHPAARNSDVALSLSRTSRNQTGNTMCCVATR